MAATSIKTACQSINKPINSFRLGEKFMKAGMIGLGNMGSEIAKRLLSFGVTVGVFDINEKAVNELVGFGAVEVNTPMELARNYPYIITILPNSAIVKEIVLGENGLIHGFAQNSLLIEMTTSIPAVTKELSQALVERSFRMIDAPVSGGVKKAENGTLSIMVGGEEHDFLEVKSLLDKIGEHVTHVGAIGAGHTIKALNNMISSTTLAITGEAIALGVKLGLDPSKMLEVINSSTGRSFSSVLKFPTQIVNRKFDSGFTLDLMVKDLKIAMSMAEDENVPMDIGTANLQLWKQALAEEEGQDHTAIVKHIEEKFQVEIKELQKNS